MAVTIAKLSTVSTLDATKFSAGLTKMRTDIGAFSAISLGAFARIGTAITSMIARGITAIPRFVTSGLELGDALSDSSKMTGIAASRLSVYYRAARLAGVGTAEFDQMIGRLNVNIAEAIAGDKKFADILKRAGVDLAKIASLSPDETFLALADAISKTGSAFDRAFIAQQAFGRGGFRLLPLLSGGRAGISNLAASTRALGAAPSDLSVQKIERANDALQDLGTAFQGLKFTLVDQIGPPLGELALRFTKWLEVTQAIPKVGTIIAEAAGFGEKASPLRMMIPDITDAEQYAINREIRTRAYVRKGLGSKAIGLLEGDYPLEGPPPPGWVERQMNRNAKSYFGERSQSLDEQIRRLDKLIDESMKQTEELRKLNSMDDGMNP